MITTGSKFFYGLASLLALAAVVYGYSTGGGNVGPISFGYKGGVGDIVGYSILVGCAAAAFLLGVATSAFRDADPEALEQVSAGSTSVAQPAPNTSYWPIVGAFSLGFVVVGVVVNNVFFVAGLIGLGCVAAEWTVQAWSERATGDAAVNREIRNRIMLPLEVPLAGFLAIAVVVLGYSRVFLAVSKENAVWAALVVAALVFGIGTALSFQKKIRADLIAGLLVVGAVATIGLGIFGAVAGERDFEHHGDDHHGEEHSDDESHSEDDSHGDESGEESDDHGESEEEGALVLEESN